MADRPRKFSFSRAGRGWPASAVLLCCVFCVSFLRAEEPRVLRLSPPGLSATAPRISAAPNADCTIVWQQSGPSAADFAIASRRRQAGFWGPVEIIAGGAAESQPREPLVRLDSSGHPHVVWVNGNEQRNFLEYTFFTESVWVPYGRLGSVSTQKIEHPVMMVGPRNQLFVVWQERVGVSYQIHAFVIDAKGNSYHHVLDGKEQLRYVIYPDLMELAPAKPGEDPRVAVAWFSLEQPEAKLEMRVWAPAQLDWLPAEPPAWTTGALESLPLVAASPESGYILVGYRPQGRYDRIFMTSERFSLAYLDANVPVQSRFPRVSEPLNGVFGFAWQQESEDGISLVQAALRPTGEIFSAPLARADALLPPQPDVALSAGSLMAVWTTLVREPATQNTTTTLQRPVIYFSESTIPDTAWRPIIPSAAGDLER